LFELANRSEQDVRLEAEPIAELDPNPFENGRAPSLRQLE
jgi:hypothetical protein